MNKSMRKLLAGKSYPAKVEISPGLAFLGLLTVFSVFFSSITYGTSIFSIYERTAIHLTTLTLSILLFIILFWKETGGDFFSFINITLLWYLVMFGLPIACVLYLPWTRIKPSYWDMASFEYSVWVVIIALYSLAVGYKIATRERVKVVLPLGRRPSLKRVVFLIIFFIGLYLLYLLIKSYMMGVDVGGLLKYSVRGSQYAQREYRQGIYTFINLLRQGPGYILLFCFLLPRDKGTKKVLVWSANLFIVLYLFNSLFSAVVGGAKSSVFGLIFFLLVLMHYALRRIRFSEVVLLGLIGIVVLTSFNYRRVPPKDRGTINRINIIPRMYAQSFEDFETLCVVTSHFPRSQDYYYGRRLFEEVAYLPIPRAFWKGKPAAYGSRAIMYDINPKFFRAGYHTGLPSQFYADFGIIGVIAGFIVFGGIVGWVYNLFRSNFHNKGIIMMYILITSNCWLFFKGGFPWLNLFIISYIPFWILLRYIYPVKAMPASTATRNSKGYING